MKPAILAALLGMTAPAALLAQTASPPADPTVTGTVPAEAGGTPANGATTGADTAAASQNPMVMPHSEGAPAPAVAPAGAMAAPAATPPAGLAGG